jgi:hypothetical protein
VSASADMLLVVMVESTRLRVNMTPTQAVHCPFVAWRVYSKKSSVQGLRQCMQVRKSRRCSAGFKQ